MALTSVSTAQLSERLRAILDRGDIPDDKKQELIDLLTNLWNFAPPESSMPEAGISVTGLNMIKDSIIEEDQRIRDNLKQMKLIYEEVQPILINYDYYGSTGYANNLIVLGNSINGQSLQFNNIAYAGIESSGMSRQIMFNNSSLNYIGLLTGVVGNYDDPPSTITTLNAEMINVQQGIIIAKGIPVDNSMNISVLRHGAKPTKMITPKVGLNRSGIKFETNLFDASNILQIYRSAFMNNENNLWDPRYTRPLMVYISLIITLNNLEIDYITKKKTLHFQIANGDHETQSVNIEARSFDDFHSVPFTGIPNQRSRIRHLIDHLQLARQGLIDSVQNNQRWAENDIELHLEVGDLFSSCTRARYYNHLINLNQVTVGDISNYIRVESWNCKSILIASGFVGFREILPYFYDLNKLKVWKSSILYGILSDYSHFYGILTELNEIYQHLSIIEFTNSETLGALENRTGGSSTETDPLLPQIVHKMTAHNRRLNDLYKLLGGWLFNGVGSITLDVFDTKLEANPDGIIKLIAAVYLAPFLTDHFGLAKIIQMMANWESGHELITYQEGSIMSSESPPNDIRQYIDMPRICTINPGNQNRGRYVPDWIYNYYRIAYETFATHSFIYTKNRSDHMPNWQYFTEDDLESFTLRYGSNQNGFLPSWPNIGRDNYYEYTVRVGQWISQDLPRVIGRFLPSFNIRSTNLNNLASILGQALHHFRVYLNSFYGYEMRLVSSLLKIPIIQRPIWLRRGRHQDSAGIDIQAFNSEYDLVRQEEDGQFVQLTGDVNSNSYSVDAISCLYGICLCSPKKDSQGIICPKNWYDSLTIWDDFTEQKLRQATYIINYNQYYQLLVSSLQMINQNVAINNWDSLNRFIGLPPSGLSSSEFFKVCESIAKLICTGMEIKYQPYDLIFANHGITNRIVRIVRRCPYNLPNHQDETINIPQPYIENIDESFYFNLAHLSNNPGLINMVGNRIHLRFGQIDDARPNDPFVTNDNQDIQNPIIIENINLSLSGQGITINGRDPPNNNSRFIMSVGAISNNSIAMRRFVELCNQRNYHVYITCNGYFLGNVINYEFGNRVAEQFLIETNNAAEVPILNIPIAMYNTLSPGENLDHAQRYYRFPVYVSESFRRYGLMQLPSLHDQARITFNFPFDGFECFRDMSRDFGDLTIGEFIDRISNHQQYNDLARLRPQLATYRLRVNLVGASLVCADPGN